MSPLADPAPGPARGDRVGRRAGARPARQRRSQPTPKSPILCYEADPGQQPGRRPPRRLHQFRRQQPLHPGESLRLLLREPERPARQPADRGDRQPPCGADLHRGRVRHPAVPAGVADRAAEDQPRRAGPGRRRLVPGADLQPDPLAQSGGSGSPSTSRSSPRRSSSSLNARTGGDYGLDATVRGLTQFVPIFGVFQILWGVPAAPQHAGVRFPRGNFGRTRAPPSSTRPGSSSNRRVVPPDCIHSGVQHPATPSRTPRKRR